MPGFEVYYEDNAPDRFIPTKCGRCRLTLREPIQTYSGNHFCKSCFDNTKEQSFPDRCVERDISKLVVGCGNKKYGCDWSGPLKYFEEKHEAKCPYVEVDYIYFYCFQYGR